MNFDEVIFLTEGDVMEIHARVLPMGGGSDGLRDPNMLLSAIGRPQTGFGDALAFPSLASMAAAYAHGLANNHPFVDANKRTAYVAMLQFLAINGHPIAQRPELPEFMERLVQRGENGVSHADLVAILIAFMGGDESVEP